MANIQSCFIQFDEAIKLRRDQHNKTLAERRERVLRTLSDGIARQKEAGAKIPGYRSFNQGSYDMKVGVKPIDGDYDIDVGLSFFLAKDEYPNPVTVKSWVHEAVKNHTEIVTMKGPCVTVVYQNSGEPIYHVDLAIYSDGENNPGKEMFLARGHDKSPPSERRWTRSDPEGLTDKINGRFAGDEGRQFRRAIRALKRWKDVNFSKTGHAAPRGIAFTVAAYQWFSSATRVTDGKVTYDDLAALRNLVGAMLLRFESRLIVTCPAEPYDDLCSRMDDAQMRAFKDKLSTLSEALRAAEEDNDAHTACKGLEACFGSDFPVPPPDPGKKQKRPTAPSGNSG
jgi:hypothetical protein